jgi:hypothetical protein
MQDTLCVPSGAPPLEIAAALTGGGNPWRSGAGLHAVRARIFFFRTERDIAVVARNCGAVRATAFPHTNFVLAAVMGFDGIKLGTAREEKTPRMPAESTFSLTLQTDTESSKRIQPSRAHRGVTARPPRLDRPTEGCTTSEDQGGPP